MGSEITTVTVSTTAGTVMGRRRPADAARRWAQPTSVFLGIPYARATRFAPPGPPTPWTGTREAFAPAPLAPQPPSALERFAGNTAVEVSEQDCLAVNVFTPGPDTGRRPVMVWIHGGAFLTGSGSTPWYDGTRFAANHDVVVVSLNYRLGALGFLHLDDRPGAGNAGILDQVAALRWVRENIAAFGGDPGNVTVFGESAGAMSVATLLAVPQAAGLFRRAILQSGAAAHVHDGDGARRTVERLRAALDIEPGEDVSARLEALGIDALLAAQNGIVDVGGGRLPFQPVVDAAHLHVHPLQHVGAGQTAGVDLLVGTTADEMRLFTALDPAVGALDRAGLIRRTARQAGLDDDRAAAIVDAYISARPGMALGDVWAAVATGIVFRVPAHELLTAHRPYGRCWQYEFRWASRAFGGRLASCHGLELPFVFDNLDADGVAMFTGVAAGAPDDDRVTIADAMHGAWAAFARAGDPNGAAGGAVPGQGGARPFWPEWQPADRATMVFDAELRVEDAPRAAELDLWV